MALARFMGRAALVDVLWELSRIPHVSISSAMNWMRFVVSPFNGTDHFFIEQVDIFPVREFVQTDAALRRAKRAISKSAETNAAQRDLLERRGRLSRSARFDGGVSAGKNGSGGDYLSADASRCLLSRVRWSMTLRMPTTSFQSAVQAP